MPPDSTSSPFSNPVELIKFIGIIIGAVGGLVGIIVAIIKEFLPRWRNYR